MRQAWLGKLGQGKSYAMTCEIINHLNNGYTVYTNYKIYWNGITKKEFNWKTKKIEKIHHPATNLKAISGQNIREILKNIQPGTKQKHVILALDEGYLYFDSYQGTKMPMDVRKFILHSRKKHIDIWYTSQRLMAIAPTMREMTDYFYKCKSLNFYFFRLFWTVRYELEDKKDGGLDENKNGQLRLYFSNPLVYNSYDTDEIINEGNEL